ncbi:MAG: hypothetical protein KAG96_05725 [Ichthyobacteriaceae bacterium]|nr:hypothetical protein [Ichthyobacteriaceae bacterium]
MKNLLILIALIYSSTLLSQSIVEAVEFSNESITGSARYNAMAGAFNAIGGEQSSTYINPAGSAVFLKSTYGVSYDFSTNTNNSEFYNQKSESDDVYSNINQVGAIFSIDNNTSSSLNRFAFGVNYNRTLNFNNNITYSGINTTKGSWGPDDNTVIYDGYSSLIAPILESASGYYTDEFQGLSYLAYETYLIDPNHPDSTNFYNNTYPTYSNEYPIYTTSAIANNNKQRYNKSSSGRGGVYSFSGSISIQNTLYLGASYNSHNFEKTTNDYIIDEGFDKSSEVTRIISKETSDINAMGDNFSFGAIYRSEFLRLGVSYISPIRYSISDIYTSSLEVTYFDNNDPYIAQEYEYISNYELKTPGKLNAGIAVIIKRLGLISVNYQYIDYKKAKLNTSEWEEYDFSEENYEITQETKGVHNISIGTEWAVSFINLRAGYSYLQSPYKNLKNMSDTEKASIGAGINFKNWNLDFSYQYQWKKYNHYMYDSLFIDATEINNSKSNITLSMRFYM